MSKNDDGAPPIPKKWMKLLTEDWRSAADSKSTDELKKNIVQWEQAISSTEKDMDNDSALNGIKEKMTDLKEDLKEKSTVYKESITQCTAQIKYAVHLLDSRGVQVK